MSLSDIINTNICRICLSQDLRLYTITNTSLQAVYEKLTDIQLSSVENVQKICYICFARLKQCHILREQAIFTDKILKDAAQSEIKPNITQSYKRLAQSSTINISLDPIEYNIKEHLYAQVKTEENEGILEDIHHIALPLAVNIESEDVKDCFSHLDSDTKYDLDYEIKNDLDNDVKFDLDDETKCNVDERQLSDSEDDLPLVNISMKKKLAKKEKAGKIRKYSRQTSVDAKEIILDEEQQKLEMLERAKSENYVNSPFKCDLCYRGFIDPVAFDRHKEKHDERSGAHACGVCALRYACARRLAAHAAAAHARRYACNRCAHVARTKHQAKAHERWHNGHTYLCKPCGRVFTKPTSLLSHVRRCAAAAVAGERACPRCGDSFARAHGLLMHLSKAHRFDAQKPAPLSEPESARACAACAVVFASAAARARHLLTSRRHRLYDAQSECVICSARVSPALRAAHTREHARALRPPRAPAPPVHVQCDQCKASFTSRPKLQSHVRRMHLGLKYNKNIVCEICGKKCTSAAALRYHQRQHTGEKPYACPACPRAFARAARLRAHAAAHAGRRAHACALCPRAFVQRAALTRHMRVHTGVKPYSCHICNKRFTQSNSLHTHVRALHLRLPRDHSTRDRVPPSESTPRDHNSSDQNSSNHTPK